MKAIAEKQREVYDASRYTYIGRPMDAKPLPKRAEAILAAIQSAGDKGITRKELLIALDGLTLSPKKDLQRLRKDLINEGYVKYMEESAQ